MEYAPTRSGSREGCREPSNAPDCMADVPELGRRSSFDRALRLVSQMAVRAETEEFYRIKFKLPRPKEVRKRAERGEPWAQCSVGLSYAHGIGVQQDHALTAQWHERAAKLGEPEAQIALAELYRTGKGVPQNPDLAYLWACLVPLTPDRQEWQARLATEVAEGKLLILRNAARELQGLIQKLRFEQSVRPSSSQPTVQEMALLRDAEAILKANGG